MTVGSSRWLLIVDCSSVTVMLIIFMRKRLSQSSSTCGHNKKTPPKRGFHAPCASAFGGGRLIHFGVRLFHLLGKRLCLALAGDQRLVARLAVHGQAGIGPLVGTFVAHAFDAGLKVRPILEIALFALVQNTLGHGRAD